MLQEDGCGEPSGWVSVLAMAAMREQVVALMSGASGAARVDEGGAIFFPFGFISWLQVRAKREKRRLERRSDGGWGPRGVKESGRLAAREVREKERKNNG